METILTPGSIEKILNGDVMSENDMIMPVLQVTGLNLIENRTQQDPSRDRFGMFLSDGTYLQHGFLVLRVSDLVRNGTLQVQVGSIVRLTRFVCNLIQNRMAIIIMELEVITTNSDIVGDPVRRGRELSGGSQIQNSEIGQLSHHLKMVKKG